VTPEAAMAQNDKSLLSAFESDARRTAPASGRERMGFLETRVHEKIDDYEDYRFTLLESRALNIFFDLAQEYTNVYDLYALCVLVPKIFFQKHCVLFLLDKDNRLEWRSSSATAWDEDPGVVEEPPLFQEPTVRQGRYYIPIKGNQELLEQIAFPAKRGVIGLLEVSPGDNLSPQERLFFEKYANRIGFQLHNRLISTKNREHLQFIRSLVDDIGHNVIVPNMYFKLFYRRLESKIRLLREISSQFAEFTGGCAIDDDKVADCRRLQKEMDYTYESLMDQFQEIYRHYQQTSLFLETLLRRGHFEQGRYVLERQPVNVRSEIVLPQVERYRGRLEERGIQVLEPDPSSLDPNLTAEVDVGLVSQVFANLFSNAVKYTRAATDARQEQRKYVSYGCTLEPDRFGPGRDGVRCFVSSTGPSLRPYEADQLYSEGFRGSNVQGEYGTGHGLHFVHEVITLHGGEVGYEPTESGNMFYFVLPARKSPETRP